MLYYFILILMLASGLLYKNLNGSDSAKELASTISNIFLIGIFVPIALIFLILLLDKIWQKIRNKK